jgi:hypothetical protein
MVTRQYSSFECGVFVATIFAAAMMALWVAIVFLGKDRTMQRLEQIPGYIDASFRHTGCRVGYVCLFLAWLGFLTDYWIGWSEGYVAWPKIINCLLSYPLVLIAHSKLPPAMHILHECWRFTKMVAKVPGRWIAQQALDWYQGRTSKRRIDRIFERPLSRITIAECLFPDLCDTPPKQSTFSQIIKAGATDLLFFSWNLTIVIIKLRIRSWRQIPSHTRDVIFVTMQVLFGLGEDDSFWPVWRGCYETALKGIRELLSVMWGLILIAIGATRMAFMMGKAISNRLLVRIMAYALPDGLTPREIKTFEDNVHNAYCETSTYSWSQIALMFLRLATTRERIAELEALIKHLKQYYDSINSREIGEKYVGYRATVIELLHDNNYYRLLLCAMLNAQYNELHGRRPNDLNAKHPYQPSQLEFRTVPDPLTGFYMGYREYTVRPVNKHDIGHEYLMQVEQIAMKYEREPLRMSGIIAWRTQCVGNVPNNFDPFVKDHWVFSGAIPGLNIPVYQSEHNPFNIHDKRAPVIVNPENLFGPQIEDFAANGRLAQWGDAEAMKPKATPFDRDEIRKFVAKMEFGAEPPRQHNVASLPKMGAYSRDPCPTGEPRLIDFPLYTKNFA